MDHHEESQFSSPALDFHIQTSLDPLHTEQFYRKLVDDILVPTSNFNHSISRLRNSHAMPGVFGFENRGQQSGLQGANGTWSSPFDGVNMMNSMAGPHLGEDFRISFPGVEPWSPSPCSEADSRLSRGSFHSTGTSPGTESGENAESLFNFNGQADDKLGEERKLARRRERNRTSQRAFRARKEKYTHDLERHYIDLRHRYETLVVLVRRLTGMEPEAYMNQSLDGCKDMHSKERVHF